jgi:hypothetical protein
MATLTLRFSTSVDGVKNYKIYYRPISTTGTYVPYTSVLRSLVPNVDGICITTIDNLGSGTAYEGYVQPECSTDTSSVFSALIPSQYNFSRDPSSAVAACSLTTRDIVAYGDNTVIQAGVTRFYSESTLATPLINGYYSDGINVYNVNTSGVVISIVACSSLN